MNNELVVLDAAPGMLMRAAIRVACVISALTSALVTPATAAPEVDRTENVRRMATSSYQPSEGPTMDIGGTDLAFDGPYVYAAEQGREGSGGGLHIFRSTARGARKLSFLRCGGWQNDVAVVAKGLVALGYHKGGLNCRSKNGGVTLVDVSNPRRPRILGSTPEAVFSSSESFGGVHTITALPDSPFLYASPGGTFTQETTEETVLDVSDPRKPVLATQFDTGLACHDVTFSVQADRTLGFCSGVGATQVWDMTDPLAPQVLASIVNPLHTFAHSSAVTADGSLLVIGTETVSNDCVGGPTGALLAYDITDPGVPIYRGFFGSPRGRSRVYSGLTDSEFQDLCAAHLFNFKGDSRTLVSGNGSGGVSVVDFSDPTQPNELAHYMSTDMPMVFSAYWHEGRVFTNGLTSFDVFDIKL